MRTLVKKLFNTLWALSLLTTVACSGQSITGPSGSADQPAQSSTSAAPASVGSGSSGSAGAAEPVPAPNGGTASSLQYSIQGPDGCVTAGNDVLRWVLNITDAGPSPVRFVALAHQAGVPGCEHTIENPRSRVDISGVLNYGAHTAGQTSFSFDPRHYSCGRVQVDVSIFDAQGHETLVVGMVVDYKTTCAPPPPPPPVSQLLCTPGGQTAAVNQTVNLSATGGTGTYEWSSLGTATRGTSATFSTAFPTHGSYSVVVTSGNATATCVVEVVAPPPPPPVASDVFCAPANLSVEVNQIARLTATGGNGSFSWGGGGSPATGTSAAFETAFASAGTYPVTVTSGSTTATCHVTVRNPPPPPPPVLVCTAPSQSVLVNHTATFNATGGTGTYAWSGGGTPVGGNGASFTTAFATAGRHTVTVSSGDASATCSVLVTEPPPPPPLVCDPEIITVRLKDGGSVTTRATGGTGSYTWHIGTETSQTSGTGSTFTTRFELVGSYRIYVRSGDQVGKCKVYVE